MKIRIKGNSLRYRLTKTDVQILTATGSIEEHICFGDQELIYALKSKSDSNELSATFDQNKITLYMPEEMIREWATTNRVGFENSKGKLFLLVEKDFVCLDTVTEDQSDNYPNPLANFVNKD